MPPRPGPEAARPCGHLLRREAAEAPGAALGPRTCGARGPSPTAAGSTAASAVSPAAPRRSAPPARSAAAAATRLPFSLALKENRISCLLALRFRGPLPAAASGPGASPPPPSPALRSAPRAPPLRPRPRAAPASWLRPQPPRAPPDVTGSSCAPPPPPEDVRAPHPTDLFRARVFAAARAQRTWTPERPLGSPCLHPCACVPTLRHWPFQVPLGMCLRDWRKRCINNQPLQVSLPHTVCADLYHFFLLTLFFLSLPNFLPSISSALFPNPASGPKHHF